MTRGLEIIALTGLALGAAHILQYARRKRQRHQQREALQTWEAEGGAVPSRTRTAAMQVTPATTAEAPA